MGLNKNNCLNIWTYRICVVDLIYQNGITMKTLNIATLPVSKKTITQITEFVYVNRAILGNEQKLFYADVKGLIDIQIKKPAANRLTMTQIMERAYNIDAYILASGAASVTTEFVN